MSSVKWKTPNIHDLMNILRQVDIEKIFDSVFDKHVSEISELSVIQLREECSSRNLSK